VPAPAVGGGDNHFPRTDVILGEGFVQLEDRRYTAIDEREARDPVPERSAREDRGELGPHRPRDVLDLDHVGAEIGKAQRACGAE